MIALLLAAAAASAALPADTLPYANAATRQLIERAVARHGSADSSLKDYQAKFRYRLSFGLGRRRWAEVPNAAAEEQEGTVQWTAPNDLRVEILGRRAAARSRDIRLMSSFDRPWFVPRALGDSIRVFGNEIPPQAAVHPLAADGASWYSYRLSDSVQISTPEGRRIRLLAVEVRPRKNGPSQVAGRLWLDAESSALVRFSFRFVGTALWLDPDEGEAVSGEDRRINRILSRVLTLDADLEYALQEERHWMPYRQVVAGRLELPWLGELVVPFEARTTFDHYEINTGRSIIFQNPSPADPDTMVALSEAARDSLRVERRRRHRREERDRPEQLPARDDWGAWSDGRYEIHRAPGDSLQAYAAWEDAMVLNEDPADDRAVRELQSDLERMAAGLPAELTGRPRHGFSWERIPDMLRYNRVQGSVPGLNYQVQLPWDPFTHLKGELRFGLGDQRLVGGLTVVREAPGARWSLMGWREVRSADPFGRGNALGNSLNAIFVAHDDADYHLTHGVRLLREGSLGRGVELRTSAFFEDQRSVRRDAGSPVNDFLGGSGRFPGNPPVTEGGFWGAAVTVDGGALRTRWRVGADALGNARDGTARLFASVDHALLRRRASPSLGLRAGITTDQPMPQQAFRAGGIGTVRGFGYGERRGQAFWAAQLDLPLTRGLVRPVAFVDAGQAATTARLFESPVIAGGGVGVAFFGGLLRMDLSHPITDGGDGLRFDLSVRGLF